MKKETIVVMLPTKKERPNILLLRNDNTLLLFDQKFYDLWLAHQEFGNFSPTNASYQHLYICTTEEIEEPCWLYSPFTKTIIWFDNRETIPKGWVEKNGYLKIIATINNSLNKKCDLCKGTDNCVAGECPICDQSGIIYLPSIPQSFINKYIEQYNKGNKIEKVMVKYVKQKCTGTSKWVGRKMGSDTDEKYKCSCGKFYYSNEFCPTFTLMPKLNGNEIVICEEEEKLYTRAEVEKSYHDNLILKAKSFSGGPWIKVEDINNWIKSL